MSFVQESPSESSQQPIFSFQNSANIATLNDRTTKARNKGGKPGWFGWNKYAKKLEEVGPSRWSAECLSCNTTWHKGSPQEIEVHLAYECQKVDSSTRDLFLQRLAAKSFDQNPNELNTPNKKRKRNDGTTRQLKITEFESTTDQINHALVKAFVICGIPWHIIENLFFIDFLKTLRPSYQPPSREVLSGRLLAQEAAVINQQVIKHLKSQKHLTLCKFLTILAVF